MKQNAVIHRNWLITYPLPVPIVFDSNQLKISQIYFFVKVADQLHSIRAVTES
jgi:hypothetical protein